MLGIYGKRDIVERQLLNGSIKNAIMEKNFNQIYEAFIVKRSLPTSSGLEDDVLLNIVLDELKIKVEKPSELLQDLVTEFTKRKLPTRAFTRYNKLSIKNLLSKGNQVSPEPLLLKIKPLHNSFDEILKSLSKIVAKDNLRPVMEGVFLNSKRNELVATDANVLLTIPHKLSGESLVINPKTNLKKLDKEVKLYKSRYAVITGKYPNYEAVIPNYKKESRNFELLPFLNQVRGLEKLSSFFDEPENFIVRLNAKNQILFIKPTLLVKLLTVMAEQGALQFRFQWADEKANSKPILLHSSHSKKMKCLVMPFMLDESDKDYAFVAYDFLGKTSKSRKTRAQNSKPIISDRKKRSAMAISLRAKSIKLKLQLIKL